MIDMINCTPDTEVTLVSVQGVGVVFRFIWISLLHNVMKRAPSLLSNGNQGLFPWGQSGRGVKLTTHVYVVPRSKEWSCNPIPPIRLHGMVLS
jgi:hypothetical protein